MAAITVVISILVVHLYLLYHVLADVAPYKNSASYPAGVLGLYPTQHFFSDPDVIAPVANIVVDRRPEIRTKYLTWAAHGRGIAPVGPQLLNAEDFSLVYQAPLHSGIDSFGITTASCNGTQYLIYWSGRRRYRRTVGTYYILNLTYDVVWNISAIGFAGADAHSGFLTPDCRFVITIHEPQQHNLEDVGLYEDSWIMECYIQTIDLATGELVFQWRSTDHVPLEEALVATHGEYRGQDGANPWDFLHINSVVTDHHGNYLISARNTNTIYYINGTSGEIIWRLGGDDNIFEDLSGGAATDFTCQHDARWLNHDLTKMSLFDNRACTDIQKADPVSRGIVLELNHTGRTVRLEAHYRAPDNISSSRQGGMQVLDTSNIFLSFGDEPAMTEHSHNGTILLDVRFGPISYDKYAHTADNYRSSQINWTGTPTWSPRIASGPSLNGTPYAAASVVWPAQLENRTNDTVYFSWNGATELKQWLVFSFNMTPGHSTGFQTKLNQVPKRGFETGLYIGGTARYVQVIALDKDDNILEHGVSAILDMQTGKCAALGTVAESHHALEQYARWGHDRSPQSTDVRAYPTDFGRILWSMSAVGLVMASYMIYLRTR